MRRAHFSSVMLVLAAYPAAAQPAPASAALPPVPATPAAAPLAPGVKVAAGHAPVVAGNLASARERALEDALRQTVDQALEDLLAPDARAAHAREVRSLLSKCHGYVRRYRVLEQGESAGGYLVRIEADLDLPALRRDTERLRPPPPPANDGPLSVLVVGSGLREASGALASALGAAGVKAEVGAALAADPARAAQAATSGGHSALALVSATAVLEGAVRGTAKLSVECEVGLRLAVVPAGGAPAPLAEAAAAMRGFADREEPARAECFDRAAAQLVARVLPALVAVSGGGGADGIRAVTVEVDVVEPAVLGRLLRLLRGLGSVSSAELRRVAAGRAELRIATRLSGSALAAAAARDASGSLELTSIETVGDLVRLRVRSVDSAGAPPAVGSPPAVDPGAHGVLKGGFRCL